MIAVIYSLEQTISLLLATKQHAIESQPFSTCQWRCFHIVGTLYDRYINLIKLSISATVFKW